jgi:hypothetical protein
MPPGPCDTKIAALRRKGNLMAIDPSGGHPAMDYAEHARTYAGFIRVTMAVIVLVALILLFMLFFLVP